MEISPNQVNKERPKKPKRASKFSQNAFYYFQSFSDNASIDGLKFVGEEGRTLTERIFWTIIITVALIFSVILVYQTFIKWIHSPVIVTFDTTQRPIYGIPFPAITICPEYKTDKFKFNFTDVYLKMVENKTLTHTERMGFDALSLICDPEEDKINYEAEYANEDMLRFLYEVAPTADQIFDEIKWKGQEMNKSYFSKVLTNDGVCYTFNALDKSEVFTENSKGYPEDFFTSHENESGWTPEAGYKNKDDIDAYPRRTFVSGIKGGLQVTFTGFRSNLDYVCGESLEGFKVSLHHPAEVPRLAQNFFRVPINQAVVVGIKPLVMTTSDDVKHYLPHDRECYLVREKKMRFFQIYNQRNCMMECLTNFTLNSCGCVSFYMPRDNETLVCGIANQLCTEEAKVLFLSGEIKRKLKSFGAGSTKDNKTTPVEELPQNLDDFELDYDNDCDCLPSCFAIDFAVETSQSDWSWSTYLGVVFTKHNETEIAEWVADELYMAHLIVFFKDMQYISSERNELYGYIDFWANVGGIIGLFTGFSFITMFEILYYLSLRLGCNIRMFGSRFWSGSPKVLKNPVV